MRTEAEQPVTIVRKGITVNGVPDSEVSKTFDKTTVDLIVGEVLKKLKVVNQASPYLSFLVREFKL